MDYSKYYKNKKPKTKENVKIERDRNIDNIESNAIDKAIYSLLLIALIIIPLFIKAHISEFISPKFTLLSSGFQADIFSYYKYIFLVIITIIIGILFIYKVMFLQHNIQKSKINLFLGILAVMVTLSAVLSPYKLLALHGMYNRHEGTVSLLCYLALFFVAANIRFSAKQIQGFLYSLYPFVIINMVLSLFAFNEKSLLEIGWINNLLLGSLPEGADVTGGEFGAAKLWGTTSNPNYISGIGSVMTVLFLTWAVYDNNKIRTSLNILMAILSLSMVLSSLSSSGFLTVVALLPIIIVLIFLSKQKLKSVIVLAIFFVLATSLFVSMANKNPRVWDETIGFIIKENPFAEQKQLSLNNINSMVKVGLSDVFLPKEVAAEEGGADSTVKFSIPTLPEPGQGAGTGRIYNWEKTLQLVKERPLVGYGLDTFVYTFPQNDPDKIANLGSSQIVIDKPHNFFINILYGTGVLSFLSLMIIFALIVIKQIKVLFKGDRLSDTNVLSISIFLSSVAYLTQGLFNDSVIATAPIFWILIGVLVAKIHQNEEVPD